MANIDAVSRPGFWLFPRMSALASLASVVDAAQLPSREAARPSHLATASLNGG
jgi:hypothetical protein